MRETCQMKCCNREAYGTDTIWLVDPSNTSEKPVCRFHYTLRKLMESSAFPALILFASYFLMLNVRTSESVLPTMLILMSSFVFVSIVTFSGLLIAEFIHRYICREIPILRENVTVTDEKGSLDGNECLECGDGNNETGVWTKYERTVEVLGVPIDTKNSGVNTYCSEECRNGIEKNEETANNLEVIQNSD